MKKLLAMLLTLALVLGMSMTIMAADGDDASEITVTKVFKDMNGGKSPEEEFDFENMTCIEVTDAAADINVDYVNENLLPTITKVQFAEGDATADGTGTGTKTATITLPEYTSVGIYTYQFNEVAGTTAGVTYNTDPIYLVVTVIEQDGKVRVAAVHCEGSHNANDGSKTDEFENTYESGTLAVSKTVTGNMGDQSKYFDVTVTFVAPDGETINSTITYTGGQYEEAVTVEDNTATIQVKHGDTVTFENIPEGVTWTVEEADYTGDGYDAATYTTESESIDAGDADTCEITNNKEQEIDTGISMDSLPYIVMIVVVAVAAVAFFMRKRASAEE